MSRYRPISRLARALLIGAMLASAPACSTTSQHAASVDEAEGPVVDPARRQGFPVVMILMPTSAPFRATRRTMMGELQKTFDVVTMVVERGKTAVGELTKAVDTTAPQCVVLMDNPTIDLFREYERTRQGRPPVPSVIVMASYVEEVRGKLANAAGIAYEVPGVTAMVNLREILTRPIARVGLLHRPAFRRYVDRQKKMAANEQIELVPIEVPADPTASDVRAALRTLQAGTAVDALWVLNDSALIRDGAFVAEVWRPELERLSVPVVVGAPGLLSASFGTFAVLPDHEALGVQAANLIFELSEEEWAAGKRDVEMPLSTKTVLDVVQARDRFGLKPNALNRVDKTIE